MIPINQILNQNSVMLLQVDIILIHQILKEHHTRIFMRPLAPRDQLRNDHPIEAVRKGTVPQIMAQSSNSYIFHHILLVLRVLAEDIGLLFDNILHLLSGQIGCP